MMSIRKLSLRNLLSIYNRIKFENEILLTITGLNKKHALQNIEQKIEITVSSTIIDRYKNEIRAIYHENIVDVDFVEEQTQ